MSDVHARDATGPRSIIGEEMCWWALELRKKRKSYQDIATELGVARSTAHNYVTQALAMLRADSLESAEELRDIEVEALNKLESQLVERIEGSPDDADMAKLSLALLKVSESRRKLLGLDAPQKVEHSGNLYTVKEASPECAAWDKAPEAE